MIEQGVVRSVQEGLVRIQVLSSSAESCASCGGCEAGADGRILEVTASEGLAPGRRVLLEVPEPGGLGPVLVVFLLPVLALVGGAVIGALTPSWTGWEFLSPTGFAFFGALVLLAPSVYLVRWYDRAVERKQARPRVLRIEG